uniref:Complement component C6-like n=1 Tax=Crocodylus porosus TaxID=8502 RepID=A0A7M4G1K4_CROPO
GQHTSVFVFFILLSTATESSLGCNCEQYAWSSWSRCSKTCNYGIQSRDRQIIYDTYFIKNSCDKLCTLSESRACNEQACPINCQLGDLGPWSECDPCVKKQFRSRSLLRPSQFGGQPCSEQLVDSRRCFPTKLCNIEEVDCRNKFQCENGRCIANKLECNGENDCGDNSDERNCRQKKSVCNRMYGSIPGVQLMGQGFNLLAGKSCGEIFDNTFNGGKCITVKNNETRKIFRVPANLETVSFQVENLEDDLKTQFYSKLTTMGERDFKSGKHFSYSGSSSGIPYLWGTDTHTSSSSSAAFKEIIDASHKMNSNFVRIYKVIAVSNFTLKKEDLLLSGTFLQALNNLPLEYNYELYSRIFDDFGTHYYTTGSLGGTYDLLYQYSTEELKNSGLTESTIIKCVMQETTRTYFFFVKFTEYFHECSNNRITERYEGSILQSAERSFSLVKGGRAEYAGALAWEKKGAFPGQKVFTDWLESTKENPVVIDYELAPILDIVKNFPCAVTKRRNLWRALIEYMDKFDPCKCAPCPNNGKPVLSGTECLCVCQAGTYGDNCEKRAPDYTSVEVDGYWSCWSSWSPCDASFKRRRTRECNNPSPLNGGKPCKGESEQEEDCYVSLFADKGAPCINDDEERREVDIYVAEPESGCLAPVPPENGFIRNEKSDYLVGEEAEVACMTGYDLVGYQFLRCLPDKTWIQESIECLPAVCLRPLTSDSISVVPLKKEYKVNETIQLRCPPGFIVTGQKQYTCGKEMSWIPLLDTSSLTCEKDEQTRTRGHCKLGEKQVGSQCVCLSPDEDCGHNSEDICLLNADTKQNFTEPSCEYLAERCRGEQRFHFLHLGPCDDSIDPKWATERVNLSTSSIKKDHCGYDTCYDWEMCTESRCLCLMPYQCVRGENQPYCVRMGSARRKKTSNLCTLGAMLCAKMKIEILYPGKCVD